MTVTTGNHFADNTDFTVPVVTTPTSPTTSPPVSPPTSDRDYIERMNQTLDEASKSLDEVDQILSEPTSPTARKTTLAVSVVIPVYNERDTIEEIVRRVQKAGLHQEIVIVDDFSLDGTREVLLQLANDPDIHLLFHGYNRGKGAALRTAFKYCTGDVVLIQDADLEYDPQDYAALLEPLEQGTANVVYGSRFFEGTEPSSSWFHRLGNRLLTRFSNRLTGQNLTDMETCYKVFRRKLLERITLEQERFGFEPELTAKISGMGESIVEVPIRYHGRSYGEGKKIGLRDAFSAMWCIWKYR